MTARGFTLIEMMVVVAIIGLLATLAGKWVLEAGRAGEVRIAAAKCKEIHDACFIYRMETGRYPASLAQLEEPIRKGARHFMRVVPDPWDNDYLMEWDGEELRIRCCGPDREEGTDDDICYEPEEE